MTEPLVNPARPREEQPITVLVLARTLAADFTPGACDIYVISAPNYHLCVVLTCSVSPSFIDPGSWFLL